MITAPGVYTVPETEYHADPVPDGSLSVSGAKRLLPPGCPALFRHEQLNGRPPKQAFDFGHAVHSLVLGVGAPIVEIDAEDWRSKHAREQREEAYAAGNVPLLVADFTAAKAAAESVLSDPLAGPLFTDGTPEESWFWQDPTFGVWRRARTDYRRPGMVVDLKTCASAEPVAIGKAVANFGYHQQHAWYVDAVRAVLDEDVTFRFVFVEKTSPYLVTVVDLDRPAVESGRRLNDRALELYAECLAFDSWPGYASDVLTVSLPRWAA